VNNLLGYFMHAENKLLSDELMKIMMLMFALYQTNTISWIVIVLAH